LRFVLLHSPLLGASGWRRVAAELTGLGHQAETPAWPRLSTIGESFYAALADSVAATLEAGHPAILVAHSGAGALVPALAARMRIPVAGVIFADAILPHPGQSWFDTAPPSLRDQLRAAVQAGQLPAWDAWWPPGALARLVPDSTLLGELTAELEPIPVAYFEDRAPATDHDAPSAYLQLSGAYDQEARIADGCGWPVARLPLHHLSMLTHPQAVAGAVVSLAARLVEAPPASATTRSTT
jgi:hypothetical protein